MSTIAQENQYQSRINFYHERLQTCGYRFHEMIATRAREVPQLADKDKYQDQALRQDVENKVLNSANVWINCLRGQHHSLDVPEYLQKEADDFKGLYYSQLAPKFVLEENRQKVLEKVFNFREGILE